MFDAIILDSSLTESAPLEQKFFTGMDCFIHFLGWIISRDTFRGMWEVIQPAKEGKLEVSYRWFRTSKDAEDWCMRKGVGAPR